jgi:integrase
MARAPTGISKRGESWQAWIYDRRSKKKVYKTFPSQAAAKAWRAGATVSVSNGTMRAPTNQTLRDAGEEWIAKCEAGEVLSRKRQPFKPSTIRGYKSDLAEYVYDELGAMKLNDVTGDDLQALVERLVGSGLSGQRVRNVLVPLMSLYRWRRRQVIVDPTRDLDLPEPGGSRDWDRSPQHVAQLLAAVPDNDRAIWGCAFYGGLRLGELRALAVANVGENSIRVLHGWDPKEGRIDPKSVAGVREVPIPQVLRVLLDAHLDRTGRTGDELLFGRTPELPFTQTRVQRRADEAWVATAVGSFLRGASGNLERTTFHLGRHFYKSALDHAGISESRADRYAGHADGRVGNRYRHLLPGQLAEDAETLNAYLVGAMAGKVIPLTGAIRGAEHVQTRMAAHGAHVS